MRTDLIGLTLNEAVDNLKTTNTRYRTIYEGRENVITADYDLNRINLHVNDSGNVIEVTLG